MKTGMGPAGAMMSDDAGAVENRLSLDPTDDRWSASVGSWKDGEEYELSVKVRQISPGEFEILSAESENPDTETPAEDNGEGGEGDAGKESADYVENPAVRKMMQG